MTTFDDETARKIRNQIEFYFSDSNLPRDDFLMKKVTQAKDGLVNLDMICSFSRMRSLLGLGHPSKNEIIIPDGLINSVAQILQKSKFLRVSKDGRKVGRVIKLSKIEDIIEQVDVRTVAASPFPYDVIMEDVESFFVKFAKVNSVRLPRHAEDNRFFCGTALIEFSSDEDADCIMKQSFIFAGATLELKPKKDFDSERAKSTSLTGNDMDSIHSNSDSKVSNYPKGILVAFSLKTRSTGILAKSKHNGESFTNNGRCEKENKDCRKIENSPEDIIKASLKNTKKAKCEKTEGSEQIISEDIIDSKKAQDGICLGEDQSSNITCHEGDEKATRGEKFNTNFHVEKDALLCEDLKDVFQRFGAVKYVVYHEGADSGYIQFEEPEAVIKACAAAEFIQGGLILKNFMVSFEAVTAKTEKYWNLHYGNTEGCLENRSDRKRKNKSNKHEGRNPEDRKSNSKGNGSPTKLPAKAQKS